MRRTATPRLTSMCLVLTCLIYGNGCGPAKTPLTPPAIAKPGANGYVRIDSTTANFQEWDGRMAVIIWTDIDVGQGPGGVGRGGLDVNGSSSRISFYGQNRNAGGRLVEWRGETADGKTGAVIINKTKYELADGPLFLVSTAGEEPQVRQLKRDLSGLQSGGESLKRLAEEDPEVKQFIADASKRQ